MNYGHDCFPCSLGNHEAHDPTWMLRPGRHRCACAGDCGVRFDERLETLRQALAIQHGTDLEVDA